MSTAFSADEDEKLADLLAPHDANYVILCPECRRVWCRERDCKTTKAVRSGSWCAECGADLKLVRDAKEESA